MYKESPREREGERKEKRDPDWKRRTEIQIPSTKSWDVYWKLVCSIVDTHTHTHTHPLWSCWLALQYTHDCLVPAISQANSLFVNTCTLNHIRAHTHTHVHTRTRTRGTCWCAGTGLRPKSTPLCRRGRQELSLASSPVWQRWNGKGRTCMER